MIFEKPCKYNKYIVNLIDHKVIFSHKVWARARARGGGGGGGGGLGLAAVVNFT